MTEESKEGQQTMEGVLSSERRIHVNSFVHVSWAVWKLEDALDILDGLLGMKEVGRWKNDEQGFEGVTLDVPGGGTQFEVIAPLNDESFVARFLRDRGPGLHHLSLEVDDIDEADKASKEFGIEPWGGVRRHGDRAEIYLHPKDAGGVLFQFFTGDYE